MGTETNGRPGHGRAALLVLSISACALHARPAAAQTDVSVRGVRRSHDATATSVPAVEASQVAGTEGDPVQVVQDLPGVARPSFGSGQLVVWGSSPADTRAYVDGVPIPALFHGSAIRSTIGSDLVRDVSLTPGAYGADYGRSLGGIVRVETRELSSLASGNSGVHGDVAADTLDGSAMLTAALGDRVHAAAAGRYGWLDGVLRLIDAPDVDRFFAVPRYDDYQAKVQIDLREHETLEAVFLGSRDDLTETNADPDPSGIESQSTRTTYERFYVRYRHGVGDGSSVEVLPWIGHDGSGLGQSFGPTPATLEDSTWRGGVRAIHRSRPASWMAATLGVDVEDSASDVQRQGSLEVPAREGDVRVFGQPPGPDVNRDAWSASELDVAPYAQLDLEGGPLVVSPGLRAAAFLLNASRRTPRIGTTPAVGLSHLDGVLEPRVNLRLRVSPRLTAIAAAGVYSQPPDPADLSAVFGNPTLGPASADHATLGEVLRVSDTLSIEAVGFAKRLRNLAVRNPSPTPPLAQALLEQGAGKSYGLQLLVRQRPWHGFSGWIAYALSRSERRDTPGGAWRLFDQDEPHVLTAVASQELGAWRFAARVRFATGLPRTPVVGAFFDARDDLYEPVFGPQNSIRLPAFWQLDARVDRTFSLGARARVTLYVEALNATGHANAEEYVYDAAYDRRGTVTGLPFVGVFGARGEM